MKCLYQHRKRNIIVKEKKTQEEVPEITFSTEDNPGIPSGIATEKAFRFKTPSSILIVGPSGCRKTYFTESLLLDYLEVFFCEPSAHDSLLLWGLARWIPNHERSWCTISQRGSHHLPFAKMVSERGFTHVRQSDGRGRGRQGVVDLFTKHSHHQNITVLYLCQDMFPPGKYAKSISGTPTTS